jgi:DNA-binding response OmpR family regulator
MTSDEVLVVVLRAPSPDLAVTLSVLDLRGIRHHVVTGAAEALQTLVRSAPALVVVQSARMRPEVVSLVGRIQVLGVPALVLVGHPTDADEEGLLAAGALDVVALPTSRQRVQTRVTAMHRFVRSRALVDDARSEVLVVHDLVINVGRREVHAGGVAVPLTKTEFDLLVVLARHPHTVVTRETLQLQARGQRNGAASSLESHLCRLRAKIVAADGPRLIRPVRGVGYRLGA